MAARKIVIHGTPTKGQLDAYAAAHPETLARKVIGKPFAAVKDVLSDVAAQEQAASGTPSLDVPGEILHMGDGSSKRSDHMADIHDAATRANAGIAGMSMGEKVGIVAAASLAITGLVKWLGKRR